jgi:hypothetical protein
MMRACPDVALRIPMRMKGCAGYRQKASMETIRLQTVIGPDGKVCVEVPPGFPPGPAEVLVVSRVLRPAAAKVQWGDFYGLGKEIWGNQDAQEYVNRLRDEWE